MGNFVVYNSSAGSGKTYTLVKEYLKIALENDNPHQYKSILATTFTNKAAAEMKERVIAALQALSGKTKLEGTPKFLLEDLIKPVSEGGLSVDVATIKERSQEVLRSILHNYNDFAISTIDKFTHKIIRTFAHDLHLPLNFDVAIDENEVLSKSIDIIIAQVGVNEKLTQLLVEYTQKKADNEENWHIEKDLFLFAKNLLKDDGELHLKKIMSLTIEDFTEIKQQLYAQTKSFEADVQELAKKALQTIELKGIEPKSFSRSFYPNYWNDLLYLKKLTPTPTAIKIINGEQGWYAKTVDDSQQQLIDANQELFIELYESSRTYIEEFESQYVVNKLLIKNLYNLAVLNEIEKAIIEFKKENNVLNISDFNKKIAQIVTSEPIPFIYERLGEKYRHYLIDEFQDTSIVQWHNLIPLIENSLGNGKFNMVVGDAKQAIYRFRGGEVEQIIHLPNIYKNKNNPLLLEREAALTRNHKAKELSNNYRSKEEVVNFNNQFFQSIATNLSKKYAGLYEQLEQGFDEKNNGGGVSVEFLNALNREVLEEQTYPKIIEIIEQNLSDNYSLKDITILTRGNKDGAAIASYLLEKGIPVISTESLLINSSKEVQFIIHLFQYIEYPSNTQFQLEIINYLIAHRYPNDLVFEVFMKYPKNVLYHYLAEKELNLSYHSITNFSLYELTEYLIQHFGLDQSVDVYLQFFLDKIYEYTSRYDNSLVNFLEWWGDKQEKFSIIVPEGVDAVRVMSIHKSKGLEFPVVIYPFAISDVKASEKYFWTEDSGINKLESAILPINTEIQATRFQAVYEQEMEKSRLDLINILYVALTRPKDRLYILSQVKFNKAGVRSTSKHGSVADYLYDYCESNPSNQTDEYCYRFGAFQQQVPELAQSALNSEVFDSVTYNSWRDKIHISYQAPEVWDVESPATSGEHGTLIHKILAEIVHQEEVDKVLLKLLNKGVIPSEQYTSIKNEIQRILKMEEIGALFTDFDELKNERGILLPSGETYQPDRVVVKDGVTYIIDYKTGDQKKSHFEQLENYKILLAQMGYQHIKGYLLYTKESNLVVV
ncbi:MAG: UvrD-helicase domain-containing protein [Vicingus serpentipes]|nr:UvrD-helicase domain-containing protein [Vicingus serpentipes]